MIFFYATGEEIIDVVVTVNVISTEVEMVSEFKEDDSAMDCAREKEGIFRREKVQVLRKEMKKYF